MPRDGEVIKPDPAAASRKKARRPRAACPRLCCREGSARSWRLQRVAKTCLSVAGVPQRSLQCCAHLQNTQPAPRRNKPKGDRGRGNQRAPASHRGRVGVNPEGQGREQNSPSPLSAPPAGVGATSVHPGQSRRDAAPAPCPREGPGRWQPGLDPEQGLSTRRWVVERRARLFLGSRRLSRPPPSSSPPAGKRRGRRPRSP